MPAVVLNVLEGNRSCWVEKKKITSKDWTYIGKCNYAAKWCRRLCSYTLIKADDDTFKRVQTISLFAYLIIFIPVHVLQIFTCVWDGGLKEFVIFSRYISRKEYFDYKDD